jgi:hypothetical protein
LEPQIEQTLAKILIAGEKVFVMGFDSQTHNPREPVGFVVRSYFDTIEIQLHKHHYIQQLIVVCDGYVFLEIKDSEGTDCSIARCKHRGSGRFLLKKIRNVQGAQLRKYIRIDVKLKYIVQAIDVKGNPTKTLSCLPERTTDISGGGMKFYCRNHLEPNSFLLIAIDLHEFGKVKTNARVVRTEEVSKENHVYLVSIEFVGIKDSDRQKIISFVEKKLSGIKLFGTFSVKSR